MADTNDWTIETLRQHLLHLMEERDKRFTEAISCQSERSKDAMIAAEKAVVVAQAAMEKRVEALNELRGVVTDQTKLFPTRTEINASLATIQQKLDSNSERMTQMMPRMEVEAGFSAVHGVTDAHFTANGERIAAVTKTTSDLAIRIERIEGEGKGSRAARDDSKGMVAIGVAILSVLISLVLAVFNLLNTHSVPVH